MGTRGFVGVVVDDHVKISYNHWDSYPDGLGVETLTALRNRLAEGDDLDQAMAIDVLKKKARDVRLVEENAEPGPVELALFNQYSNPDVGGSIDKPTDGSVQNYYQLLRDLQGNLLKQLDLGIMIDTDGFQLDSLFCEWGYLLDLDAGAFEVYKGFQHARHDKGRWAGLPTDQDIQDKCDEAKRMLEAGEINEHQFEYWSKTEYHSVALVAAWPLDNLPSDADFAAAFLTEDEEA